MVINPAQPVFSKAMGKELGETQSPRLVFSACSCLGAKGLRLCSLPINSPLCCFPLHLSTLASRQVPPFLLRDQKQKYKPEPVCGSEQSVKNPVASHYKGQLFSLPFSIL